MGRPKDEFGIYTAGRCWLGKSNHKQGYHRSKVNGRMCGHREAYEVFYGPIPVGHNVDHLCRFPNCYNPAHLDIVTQKENVARGKRSILPDACIRGHPYTDENTYITSDGSRQCRECNAYHARKRRAVRNDGKIRPPAKKSYCRRGHILTPDNVYVRGNGDRLCKTCHLMRQKKWHDRKRG